MSESASTRVLVDREPRSRVLNGGKLVVNNGQSVIDCVVRNMSQGGARVALTNPTVLPAQMELLIVKSNMLYPVDVRWNRSSDVGLRFTGPGKVTAKRY